MKIYTSYHAKAKQLIENGIYPISISVQFPRYSKIKYPTYALVAPTYAMLKMSNEDYYKIFDQMLAKLDPKTVYHDLRRLSQDQDIAILCYEADINQCHRKRVGEWLNEKLGIEVKEFKFEKKEVKKKPVSKQKEMF